MLHSSAQDGSREGLLWRVGNGGWYSCQCLCEQHWSTQGNTAFWWLHWSTFPAATTTPAAPRLKRITWTTNQPTNQPTNQLDTLNLHKTNSQTSHSTNQPKLSALTMSSISVQSSVSSSHNLASICKRQLFEAAGNCHTGHNVQTKHNARSVSSTIRFHSIGKNFNKVQNVGETLVWFGL